MKKYKITVDGKSYDVVVEEVSLNSDNKITEDYPVVMPIVKQSAKPASEKVTTLSNSPSTVQTEIIENATPIKAVMPGTILSFNVGVGDSVKNGDTVLILEAMKMENEIVSPVDGVVKSINVETGSSVSEGDILLQIG